MKLRRKAKTTPVSRFLLVSRVEDEHWMYAEAAAAFGVSERTVGKWVRRFRLGGVVALEMGRPAPARRRIRHRSWRST
jgi:transposase